MYPQTLRRSASASDANLNLNLSQPPSSPLPPPPPSSSKKKFAVLSPALGAKFLASEEGRRASAVADEFEGEEGFSVREVVGREEEGSLRELTRRASAEDEIIKAQFEGEKARERKNSVVRGIEAGLGSPFESPVAGGGISSSTREKEKEKEKEKGRRPPISGTNLVSIGRGRKNSNSSTGSTGSVNRDEMMISLAEGLKKERRRCELYEREILALEEEIGEVEGNVEVMKEKYTTLFHQQSTTIHNLQHELNELLTELSTANDLDPKTAEGYLLLLSDPPKGGSRFAELGVRGEEGVGVGEKKKFKLSKRIDARLASREPDVVVGVGGGKEEGLPVYRRPRKLSRSPTPPIVPSKTTTSTRVGDNSFVAGEKGEKEEKREEKGRKAPPISGIGGGGVRKRKGSLKGFAKGTIRLLFPSNSPTSAATTSRPSIISPPPPTSTPEEPRPPPTRLPTTAIVSEPDSSNSQNQVEAWLRKQSRAGPGEVGVGYSNLFA